MQKLRLIAESAVRFDHRGIEIPVLADFDFFEDVDAIFAAVAVAALGHVRKPFFRPSMARKQCKADTMIDTTVCKCKKIKGVAERVGFEPC